MTLISKLNYEFRRVSRRISKANLKINRTFIVSIIEELDLTTTEITKLLNLHRTNLTRVKGEEQLLTMEHIHILLKVSGLSWDHILKHTDKIRIGKLTSLDPDRNFIDFLIEEKNLK